MARALAADPPILILDEAFGALDPITRSEMQKEFRALQQRMQKAVIFVTHDLREALLLADRIALHGRRPLDREPTAAEFTKSQHPLVRAYMEAFSTADANAMTEVIGMDFWHFMVANRQQVLELTLEHITLAGISTLIAAAVGVPLGILITRVPKLSKLILGGANIIQTIPSLALFGFLIPAPWIGDRASRLAILALALYGSAAADSQHLCRYSAASIPRWSRPARAMGLTDRQLLFQVELPLASGVIVAGVRIAAVLSIGLATIAAAIGAGGLGEFIFRGLAMVNNDVILAGAVPAAMLALAADFLLGVLERRLNVLRVKS